MDYKLVLDVIVAILLAATIGYAVTLNTRLNQLRRNRDELAKLVEAFNDATQRAEAGIPKLRKAAEEAGAGLQERVEKAQSLRDDLAFMIERADAMANRLEGSVRSARDLKPAPAAAPAAAAPSQNPMPQASMPQAPAAPAAPARPAGRSAPSGFPPAGGGQYDDDRSEAERELLRALQSVR